MTTPFESEEREIEDAGGLRKQLEQRIAAEKEAEARAAVAERKLAFAEAGIKLDDPRAKYFVAGYDGEINPEAIKAAAFEGGFLSPPEPAVSAAELQQHQAAAQFSAGAQGVDTITGWENNPAYQAEMAQARTKDEVFAVMAKYGSERVSQLD